MAAFGTPAAAETLEFVANYEGPLFPVYTEGSTISLAATHRDEDAGLDLKFSAQQLDVDQVSNRVTGTASFFGDGARDLLQGTFSGILHPPDPGSGAEKLAYVFVTFTGGTGRFSRAIGHGIVEAQLFLSKAASKGTIRATVILPHANG